MKAAPWRVRARFGQKKSEHFVVLTCMKVGSNKNVDKNLDKNLDKNVDKNLDEKRFVGKNFSLAKDAMVKGLAEFCLLLPTTATQIPVEKTPGQPGVIPGLHKKVLKPWSPPPRRE
jgi:hypothetical protein